MTGPELTPKERRAGLAFAARLAEIALEAPDEITKKETRKAVRAIESQYGWSQSDKRERILELIHDGAASHAELIAESGFHRDDVYRIVEDLKGEGIVLIRQLGHGSGGRPPVRIFPK
jgi:hypothetical protein